MIAFSHQGLEGQYHLSIHRAPFNSWGNTWPTRKQTPWWSKPGGLSFPPFTRAYFAYILTHSVTQTPNWTRALKGPHRNSSSIVTGALTALNNHIYPGLYSRQWSLLRPGSSGPLGKCLVKYHLFSVGLFSSWPFILHYPVGSPVWSSKSKLSLQHLQTSVIPVGLPLLTDKIPTLQSTIIHFLHAYTS